MPGVGAVVWRASTKHSDARRTSGVRHVWLGWIPARAATSRPARHLSSGASANQARPKSFSCVAYLMPRHYRVRYVAFRPSRSACGANPKAAPASHALLAPPCEVVVRGRRLGFSDSVDAAGMGSPRGLLSAPKTMLLANDGRARLVSGRALPGQAGLMRRAASLRNATWLILPVVICLSQRLSHACLSISNYTAKLRMAH